MATLPSSNTDSATKTDRQATGAQPDNTPVGGAGTNPGPGGGVTSIATGNGITASASTGAVTLTAKVDGTTIGFDGSGQLETLGGFTNPMTTLGDMIDGGSSGTPTRLAVQTSGHRRYLSQASAAAPGWVDAPIFNVRDYGAVGDNSTDATTAINLAIADLNARAQVALGSSGVGGGGGVLYFPASANGYLVGGTLTTITQPCWIRGDGMVSTSIHITATTGFVITLATTVGSGLSITDLFIWATNASAGPIINYNISASTTNLTPVIYCNMMSLRTGGTSCMELTGVNDQQGTIANSSFMSGPGTNPALTKYGIKLSNLGGIVITGCQFVGVVYGVYIAGNSEGNTIINCLMADVFFGVYALFDAANTWVIDTYIGFYCKGVLLGTSAASIAQCVVQGLYTLNGNPSGTNIFYASGAPSGGTGSNGDIYQNSSNGDLYSKYGGSWGSAFANIANQYQLGVNNTTAIGIVLELHGYDTHIVGTKSTEAGADLYYRGIVIDDGASGFGNIISDSYIIHSATNAIYVGSAAYNTLISGLFCNDIASSPVSDSGTRTYVTNIRSVSTGSIVEGPWCGAKAMLQLTSNQAILTGTATPIPWSAIRSDDSAGVFWSSGSPTVITVPVGAVKISISVNVKFLALPAGTDMELTIADQSGNILAGTSVKQDTSSNVPLLSLALIDFDLSVYTSVTSFVVSVFQNSGGGATLIGSSGVGAHNCMISVTR